MRPPCKKLLSMVLAVCLSVSVTSYSASAEARNVCQIDVIGYPSLDSALNAIGPGQSKTIKLLTDVYYQEGIAIADKSVTFALNGYELYVENSLGIGLQVTNGTVGYTGEGEFNVRGETTGVYVDSSTSAVTVTSAVGHQACGVNASAGRIVVTDYVVGGSVGAQAVNSGEVTIGGDVRALNADSVGAWAVSSGSVITIEGLIYGENYIRIGSDTKQRTDGMADPEKPGYLKYGEADGGIVWVQSKICAIDETEYETLEAALADVPTASKEPTTIRLLKNVNHDQGLICDNIQVTFELNGFSLNISSSDEEPGLSVINGGCVDLSGEGALNVRGKHCGVYAFSEATPSAVTVTSAEAAVAGGYGAYAAEIASITILEDVISVQEGGYGAVACNTAYINVKGDAIAAGTGVEADSATIYVEGSISAGRIGIRALAGSAVIVDGDIGAHQYITFGSDDGDIPANQEDGVPDPAKPGYLRYGHVDVPDTDVWVMITTYALTVLEGTGSGNYVAGAAVAIAANMAPEGKQFKEWTGADELEFAAGSKRTATATFNMPANAVTLTATYEDIPVSITEVTVSPDLVAVQRGTAHSFSATVSGTGAFDDTVTWKVTGGVTGTSIDDSGVLTVAAEETAETLTVTAAANGDNSKRGEATVTVTDAPAIRYALTVNDGSGSGEYAEGAAVTLTAATPAEDKVFDKWIVTSGTLDLGDDTANPITISMPAAAIIVEATYRDKPIDPAPTYAVVMIGGGTGATGVGSYAEGEAVNIQAGRRSNYTFAGWTSPDVTIDNAGNRSTSFAMPAKHVTVTANWSYSGGDDSSSDSSYSIIVTPPASDRPNTPTQGEVQVSGKVDSKGNLTVDISEKELNAAFDKALADARKNSNESNGVTLVLRVNTGSSAVKSATFVLPKAVQEFLISSEIVGLVLMVDNLDLTVSMDLAAMKEISRQASANVNVSATRVVNGELTGKAEAAIGSRPAFGFKISYGNNNAVQHLGAGSVSMAIPYTLGRGEKEDHVQAVHVDASGKVQWLISSVYDSLKMMLYFSTNHFSTYGVGYKQDVPDFADINDHWAKGDILFVANRGLLDGTSDTIYSPNAAMTRGMFVTALGRLANADVSAYRQSSFSDVSSDTSCLGHIEWANKSNIVNGIGNGLFAPEQSITREQLAVMLGNYARTIGFTLPKLRGETSFADSDLVSAYAQAAVQQMQMANLINGRSGNLFDPQGIATRAEASAVLHRFVELAISSDILQGWVMNGSGKWMYYENGKPVTGNRDIDGSFYKFDQGGITLDLPHGLNYTTYVVQEGDSYWLIAQNLSCSMGELERLNNRTRFELIRPGDVLRAPEK